MKQIILIFLVTILVIPAVALAGLIGPARVVLAEGDVTFRSPDAAEWLPVSINTPLDEGDVLWVPSGSRSEIQLADGTVIRVDGGSQLDLIAIEDGFSHLHLASGRLYIRTPQKAGKNSLQIDADDTTVLPDTRTRLRIDMLPNSQEDVSIFKGSAYVEGNGNRTKVRAGEHIALEEGHSELLPLNVPDNWEKWNSDRDRSQSRTASTESNLPNELQAYSRELDSHGRWVEVPEYGMVWRPTVILSDDWAPYQSGRWIWKGDDYVWISYENWGWAPYHFGRWAVVSNLGWCWVPPARGDIYWGPGYVGWYRSGNHVGWTPLAPGETFYGRRDYGRHSVNISNNSINTSNIEYRNRNARGGFSILLQNDFLRGRTVIQRPSNSESLSVSVTLGSPRIQPLRETRMPIVNKTPPRIAPPVDQHQNIRELQVRFPRLIPVGEKQPRQHFPVVADPSLAHPTSERSSTPLVTRYSEDKVRPAAPRQDMNIQGHRDSATVSGKPERITSPISVPLNGAAKGQNLRTKETKQKKVWKVTTTEQDGAKEARDKDIKEHKGRK
jgi:hypothetical protein